MISQKKQSIFNKNKFMFKNSEGCSWLNYHNHKFEDFKKSEIYEFLNRVIKLNPNLKI